MLRRRGKEGWPRRWCHRRVSSAPLTKVRRDRGKGTDPTGCPKGQPDTGEQWRSETGQGPPEGSAGRPQPAGRGRRKGSAVPKEGARKLRVSVKVREDEDDAVPESAVSPVPESTDALAPRAAASQAPSASSTNARVGLETPVTLILLTIIHSIHSSKDSIKIKIKDRYTSPKKLIQRGISLAPGNCRRQASVRRPKQRWVAWAPPTLLTRAVAGTKNVAPTPPPPPASCAAASTASTSAASTSAAATTTTAGTTTTVSAAAATTTTTPATSPAATPTPSAATHTAPPADRPLQLHPRPCHPCPCWSDVSH
ncbi:unnamed protein product [Closterium sp. NIES-64]|nr:unnamed protein product [Closterium sp. NIES-64]